MKIYCQVQVNILLSILIYLHHSRLERIKRVYLRKNNDNPGPGTYNGKSLNNWVTQVKYVQGISPQRNNKKLSDQPGPGQYTVKSMIGEGPQVSIKGKSPEK